MENGDVLHVVMFPWLAMGHLTPFLRLSKCLAQRGHRVSFVSTPRNLQRLPPIIPPHLSSLINLVSLPLPNVHELPDNAESSTDIPHNKSQFLKKAFDLLKLPLTNYLQESNPDWIVYDYASHWVPHVAAKLGISRAYFSLFNAAVLSFIGPPSVLISGEDARSTAEDFTVVPEWVPFPSDLGFRLHEVMKIMESSGGNESGASDWIRFGVSADESDVVGIRSCAEFEPEWFNLVAELYRKPVVPVGFLPPSVEDVEREGGERWVEIKEWLDEQRPGSVVYAALGTEATLSRDELKELALGLEQSGLPFFWVVRKPPGSTQEESEMVPEGLEERTKGRGIVYMGSAPQVQILAHPAVGGFLTHCGWNSVIEGVGLGRVLIMLPVMNEQGLNARVLGGKKVGVEIHRDERDGSFTAESVAESVRLAMVEKEGESVRAMVREMRGLFGDQNRNDRYVEGFVRYLEEHKPLRTQT